MLRSLAIVFCLAFAAVPVDLAAPTAHAQPNPGGFVPNDAPPPESTMRKPEQLTGRPSGFWTSTRPALGTRYRWRIMGMGLLAAAIMAFFVVRMLRRASASRART